ncbi:MAG: CHAD domain-containing protein [Myxococcota bacterium]
MRVGLVSFGGMNRAAHAALARALSAAQLDAVLTVDAQGSVEAPERGRLPAFGSLERTLWTGSRVAAGKARALFLAPSPLAPVLAELPPGSALFAAEPWTPKITTEHGITVIQTGPGGGGHGDPRARFAVLDLDAPTGAELVYVPYPLQPLAEGPLSEASQRYLVHLLSAPAGEPRKVGADHRGPDAVARLISRRTAQTFGPGSQRWPQDDVELVHDVRVASRRLRAALEIARHLLPSKPYRRAKEHVAQYGRDLGRRRSADVSLEIIRSMLDDPATTELDHVVLAVAQGLLELRRARTTARLLERHQGPEVLAAGLQVLELISVCPEDTMSVGEAIAEELAWRRSKVEARLPRMQHQRDDEGHHELRIALKRLRYTLEIAHEAFPEAIFGHVAHEIRHLQESLGGLHDVVETLALLGSHRVRRRCPAGATAALQERLTEERHRRFEAARRAVEDRGTWIAHTLRHAALGRSSLHPVTP